VSDTGVIHELVTNIALIATGLRKLGYCSLVCIPLTFLFPVSKRQSMLRHGMAVDIVYWLQDAVLYRPVEIFLTFFLVELLHFPAPKHFVLASCPVWQQFVLLVLAIDFSQYWVHRALHHELLWNFHAIHHSSRSLDWLSSARLHPINTIIYSVLPGFVIYNTAVFTPAAFALYGMVITIYSPLLHSNLNWTFGPLRYVIGSPIYHRWHHSIEGNHKNLALFFPCIDLAFGTFYMPSHRVPSELGTAEPVPEGFLKQLIYPFRRPSSQFVQES
jgi:sterol desaturase/sphingolipid hydroxylase (fatty acid hydroxylase superfamily)